MEFLFKNESRLELMAYSRHIFIQTNLSCNLKCTYCYEREKNGEIFDEHLAFNKLRNILSTPTKFGTKIKLIGGEPFLVFPQVRSLCENLWALNLKEKFFIQITTNGTLVHGEVAKWLQKNKEKLECKLSIDGDKDSHNINRPHSFELIDTNFFTTTWPKGTANMVVTPTTLRNFSDNVKFLHSRGFYNIVPIFAVLTGWANKGLEKLFYEQLSSMADFYLANPYLRRCQTLRHPLDRVLLKDCDYPICEIGRKQAFDIKTDKLYPRHLFFPSICREKMPSNFEGTDFSKRSALEKEPCLSCQFINICHTCYAANHIERGAFANRDMTNCKYMKISFLVNAKLEYKRILSLSTITDEDYSIMMAIKSLMPELNSIEKQLL